MGGQVLCFQVGLVCLLLTLHAGVGNGSQEILSWTNDFKHQQGRFAYEMSFLMTTYFTWSYTYHDYTPDG